MDKADLTLLLIEIQKVSRLWKCILGFFKLSLEEKSNWWSFFMKMLTPFLSIIFNSLVGSHSVVMIRAVAHLDSCTKNRGTWNIE